MRTWSRYAVTSALALALAAPAFAQGTPTAPAAGATDTTAPAGSAAEKPMSTDKSMSGASGSGTGGTTAAGAPPTTSGGDVIAEQESGQTLSSDLVGMKVVGADDETIGEVSELIVENNQVTGAVLEVGGFLGLGAKKVGVPWDALSMTEKDGSLTASVSLTKEQLTSMPEFKTIAEAKAERSRATTGTTGAATSTGGTTRN